jgi:Protein NO VEIN, C-terminal
VPQDLVKMPQEAIGLFPQLRAMVDQVTTQPAIVVPESPAEQAEEAVQDAAGKIARRGRGQGFQLDQEAKVAVEACAMNAATEFYGKDWDVEDVHATESYDLICRRGDEVKHVEVKGTTTDEAEVILTPNEVTHARETPCTALFVLSGITVERAEDGTVTATGGKHRCYDPWRLDDGTLTPVGACQPGRRCMNFAGR